MAVASGFEGAAVLDSPDQPRPIITSLQATGQTERCQMELSRRGALAMIACAISVAPSTAADDRTEIVTLSAETETIIQSLIVTGYHKDREEVVRAAIAAFMARYGNE
jgi:hypothetical protein